MTTTSRTRDTADATAYQAAQRNIVAASNRRAAASQEALLVGIERRKMARAVTHLAGTVGAAAGWTGIGYAVRRFVTAATFADRLTASPIEPETVEDMRHLSIMDCR
jgi:hypothetical protein